MDKIQRVRVLQGHTDPDSAYQVDDYPYSFKLRCKIRYWIETAEKGPKKGEQRFMSQTTDARRGNTTWNKPKGSTYVMLAVLYLDDEDKVRWSGAHMHMSPVENARWRLMGIVDQLTENQRKYYDTLVRIAQRSHVTGWNEFTDRVTLLAGHIRDTGEDPEVVNGTWTDPVTGRLYYLLGDSAVLITLAREQAAQPA